MDKIIVAFESDNSRKKICEMLESGDLHVQCSCRSGHEVIRYVHKMGGGIVICGYKLSEMTAIDLAADLGPTIMVLVVASPVQLSLCTGPGLFRLPTPVSRSDLLASIRMLLQMEEMYLRMTLPRKTEKEKALIAEAKNLLMSKNGLTEDEAHRFIQKKSMDTGSRMADTAQLIIEAYS